MGENAGRQWRTERGAWHAAVHKGSKESDVTEWIIHTLLASYNVVKPIWSCGVSQHWVWQLSVKREASKPSVPTITMDVCTLAPLSHTTMGRSLGSWRQGPALLQDMHTLTMITCLWWEHSYTKIAVDMKWPLRHHLPVLEWKEDPTDPQTQTAVGLFVAIVTSKGSWSNWKIQIQSIPL